MSDMTQPDTVTLPRATVDAVRDALKPVLNHYDYSDASQLTDETLTVIEITVGDLRKATAALALLDGVKDNG